MLFVFRSVKGYFDFDDHNLLRNIYNRFGIRGKPHVLMSSYLAHRYHYVKVFNSVCTSINVDCGVPQGSCLGPLLFFLYVNDIPSASNFGKTIFADDTCLMMADKNLKQLETRVPAEIERINSWFRQNKLTLNKYNSLQRFKKSPLQCFITV